MNTVSFLIGMLKSPRRTLPAAIADPRPAPLAATILAISAACSAAFLLTRVGQLAALDQQVRQLESLGTVVGDGLYGKLRALGPYRALISVLTIALGWPLGWALLAALIRFFAGRPHSGAAPTFRQVFAVVVCASSVLALRSIVALPINYLRESIGGATSMSVLFPGLGDATFVARLFGALDIFVLWWVVLIAIGVGMVYRIRAAVVARWLVGAYAAGAAMLALAEALRGGV